MTAALPPRLRTIPVSFLLVICSLCFVISAEAAGLSGRVVDPDGRAVANAEVFVSGAAVPMRVRTNADGRFDLPTLDAGRYSIIVTAPGLVSDAQSIDIAAAPVDTVA